MTKPNTIGLGEYTDADLLAELVERGVMDEVIGEDEQFVKPTTKRRTYAEISRYSRQALKNEQRTRLATLIKGDRK